MKILIVDRASAFSIWTLMNAVAAAALEAGHEVAYCVLDLGLDAMPEAPPGVRVHRIRASGEKTLGARVGRWLRFSRAFLRLLREERPDVVHTNFSDPGAPARLIARAMGVRRIVSTHHEMRGSLNRLHRLALSATDWTAARNVYVSVACARSFGVAAPQVLARAGEAPTSRRVVVRNGMAPPWVVEAPPPVRAIPLIVSAGRLMPRKGFGDLIDAVGALAARGRPCRLEISGDGPMRASLEIRAADAGASVALRGWTPHAATLAAFASAECVVVPSDPAQEGFGLVLAEALALAARVVCTDMEVFHEIAEGLEEGVTFFPPGDAEALADAIAAALDAPPDPDLLAARRALAAARFDIGEMARIYLGLYAGA